MNYKSIKQQLRSPGRITGCWIEILQRYGRRDHGIERV